MHLPSCNALRWISRLVALCYGMSGAATSAFAQDCTYQVNYTYSNLYRYAIGVINTECGGVHSPPWGNWGVNSNYGSIVDGRQFEGWLWQGSTYQWNSCTTGDNGAYAAPNPNYYNHLSFTQQKSADNAYVYGVFNGETSPPLPCGLFDDTIVTISNSFMDVFELDPWCCNQRVETLYYPNINIPINCSAGWCHSESGWTSPSNGSHITAQIKIAADVLVQ